MYQFTTTNVINSQYVKDYEGNNLLDSAGNPFAVVVGDSTGLSFPKIGFFKKAGIVSIYKRPYAAGVKEVAKVRIPVITNTKVARIDIMIKLEQSTNSEYTNYSLDFQKPVTVEVMSTGVAATTCDALVAQLNGLKDRFGYRYFTAATVSTDYLQITCNQVEQRVKSMVISEQVLSPNSIIQPEYTDVSASTFSVTTSGKIGFGDDNWMLRKVMLPTAENVRVFGISKNERPVMGGNYSEYVLRYSITKDDQDGTLSGATSVTTHVFYVISTEITRFEQEITDAGLTVPAVFAISPADAGLSIDVSDGDTDQITYLGNVGSVTFSSNLPAKATVSATGLVTAVAAAAAVIITATDSVGNTDTLTYEVTA